MRTEWLTVNIEELEVSLYNAGFLTNAKINLECIIHPAEKGNNITPGAPVDVSFGNFIVLEVGDLEDQRGNKIPINKSSFIIKDAIEIWLDTMTEAQRERIENRAIELDKSG